MTAAARPSGGVRAVLKPLLVPLLRRDPGEIDRASRAFRIDGDHGRRLVSQLGQAFLGGYNTMLESGLEGVAAKGPEVTPHYRPFFFEGAAMGYIPRGYYSTECSPESAEAALLALNPDFKFLYYVGLGFWFGFRHPRAPERLQKLEPHLDPMLFPLCYDGFGFKLGFFDYSRRTAAAAVLERGPAAARPYLYQGFGRSLFFVYMNDEDAFASFKASAPAERRGDLELGRSLACGFTGVDRPEALIRYLDQAESDEDLGARLTGVTWAMAARRMNDREYFERCLAPASDPHRELLETLPELCDREFERADDYADWQLKTRSAVLEHYRSARVTGS